MCFFKMEMKEMIDCNKSRELLSDSDLAGFLEEIFRMYLKKIKNLKDLTKMLLLWKRYCSKNMWKEISSNFNIGSKEN